MIRWSGEGSFEGVKGSGVRELKMVDVVAKYF